MKPILACERVGYFLGPSSKDKKPTFRISGRAHAWHVWGPWLVSVSSSRQLIPRWVQASFKTHMSLSSEVKRPRLGCKVGEDGLKSPTGVSDSSEKAVVT